MYMLQKQTNKQTKNGKKKQKKDELPLHAYSDIAQYVPLQLYLITIIYHNYHNYTELLIIVKIKSKKKGLKSRFFFTKMLPYDHTYWLLELFFPFSLNFF